MCIIYILLRQLTVEEPAIYMSYDTQAAFVHVTSQVKGCTLQVCNTSDLTPAKLMPLSQKMSSFGYIQCFTIGRRVDCLGVGWEGGMMDWAHFSRCVCIVIGYLLKKVVCWKSGLNITRRCLDIVLWKYCFKK